MAIQGDLSEFTIPELFQFVHQHSKNGCLNIKEERLELLIYFQEGKIVGVCPKERSPVDFWCEILSRAGYLKGDEDKRLRKRKNYDLTNFREILVREGVMSEEELEELLQRQSQELLLRALKLKKGAFFFSTEDRVPVDLRLSEPIFVEAFLLDGLRMLDEWPIIRKRIGSLQRIPYRRFKTVSSIGSMHEDVHQQGLWLRLLNLLSRRHDVRPSTIMQPDAEEQMSPVELDVYKRINGKHSIQQIIEESMQGEYPVCKALLALIEKGWVELASHVMGRQGFEKKAKGARKRLIEGFYLLVVIFSLFMLIHAIAKGAQEKDIFWKRFPKGCNSVIYGNLNQQRRQRVVHALEMYMAELGKYPETLGLLADERFLRDSDIQLLGRNRYAYHLRDNGGYDLMIVPEVE